MKTLDPSLEKIFRNLRTNNFYVLGKYERIYPDAPEDKAHGEYTIFVNHYVFGKDTFSYSVFDVNGIEELDTNHPFELTLNLPRLYFINRVSKAKFWCQVRKLLASFENEEALLKYVEDHAGFKRLPALLQTFNLMKNELPDGETFEDFVEHL